MFDPEKPPELAVTGWLNTRETITLAGLSAACALLGGQAAIDNHARAGHEGRVV